jgi:hypothetical protein
LKMLNLQSYLVRENIIFINSIIDKERNEK